MNGHRLLLAFPERLCRGAWMSDASALMVCVLLAFMERPWGGVDERCLGVDSLYGHLRPATAWSPQTSHGALATNFGSSFSHRPSERS